MTETKTETQSWSLERTFACTPEAMWAAWTDPQKYAKWISPFPGQDAEIHEFDVRVGGKVRFTMVGPDGTRFPETSAVFEVLEKPNKIVMFEKNDDRDDIFAGYPMRATTTIEPVDEGTRLVFEQNGLPPQFPVEEAKKGFGAVFDKLDDVVTGDS